MAASLVAKHGSRACGLQYLQRVGSEVSAQGLWNTASVVVVHGLICPMACGNLRGPGIKLVSPALQGGFLIPGLPGEPGCFSS